MKQIQIFSLAASRIWTQKEFEPNMIKEESTFIPIDFSARSALGPRAFLSTDWLVFLENITKQRSKQSFQLIYLSKLPEKSWEQTSCNFLSALYINLSRGCHHSVWKSQSPSAHPANKWALSPSRHSASGCCHQPPSCHQSHQELPCKLMNAAPTPPTYT